MDNSRLPYAIQRAEAEALTAIAPGAWRMRLRGHVTGLRAGHYVRLISKSGMSRCFSLASRPLILGDGTTAFELIVAVRPGHDGTAALVADVEAEGAVDVEGPFGQATLKQGDRSGIHVFVGFDSGYAYVRGLLQELLATTPSARALLFRFSRGQDAFPDAEFIEAMERAHGGLKTLCIIGEAKWPRSPADFVLEMARRTAPDARLRAIYVGGGARRSLDLMWGLFERGIPADEIISDHSLRLEPSR